MSSKEFNVKDLFAEIKAKVKNRESGSYCGFLSDGGVEKVTRKIGEEATEVIIASFLDEKAPSQSSKKDLIGEICDLLFHISVLMAQRDIEIDDILQELKSRNENK